MVSGKSIMLFIYRVSVTVATLPEWDTILALKTSLPATLIDEHHLRPGGSMSAAVKLMEIMPKRYEHVPPYCSLTICLCSFNP